LNVLPKTVEEQWDSPKFKEYRDLFPVEYRSDPEAFQAHVRDLVSQDKKISYLKSLQGYLWEEGYRSGEIKAPLFADVPAILARWHGKGIKLMIYSSGSVPAQKLLFQHTNAEPSDLTRLISDWFDTVNAGLKTEVASYETIAKKHPEFLPSQFLFLSDNAKEVEAAIKAGMRSYVVRRSGNADLAPEVYEQYQVVETFESIEDDFNVKKLQTLGKRSADEVEQGETQNAKPAAKAGESDPKRLKTAGDEEEKKDEETAANDATTSTQAGGETAEEPSKIDKLLAEAVGEAPATEPATNGSSSKDAE
jgi:enolase-phosphatase E1